MVGLCCGSVTGLKAKEVKPAPPPGAVALEYELVEAVGEGVVRCPIKDGFLIEK